MEMSREACEPGFLSQEGVAVASLQIEIKSVNQTLPMKLHGGFHLWSPACQPLSLPGSGHPVGELAGDLPGWTLRSWHPGEGLLRTMRSFQGLSDISPRPETQFCRPTRVCRLYDCLSQDCACCLPCHSGHHVRGLSFVSHPVL